MSLLSTGALFAQEVQEPKSLSPDWTNPFPPFRIVGNVYWVGTFDLGCYLITTSQGDILINTGLASSDTTIFQNIKALGFRPADIKILLTTQAHYDHMGAMASIKKSTGAKLLVDEKDGAVVADGGKSDYAFGGEHSTFQPVKPDRLLQDGDTIRLGEMQILLLHHPGHTKGSCSYLFTVKDENRSYRVLIANMPSIVVDPPFQKITSYPEIAADYAYTFDAMKSLSFDIWLSSHASQFNLHQKHRPGDPYNPPAFYDRKGYDNALARLQALYEEKLRQKD